MCNGNLKCCQTPIARQDQSRLRSYYSHQQVKGETPSVKPGILCDLISACRTHREHLASHAQLRCPGYWKPMIYNLPSYLDDIS